MAATNDARVDTTFIGYLLIGFVLLLFGVLGLQEGGLFGNVETLEDYAKLPLDMKVCAQVMGLIGLVLILLTVFAYRTGKGPSAAVFAFFGIYFIIRYVNNVGKSSFLTANSDWFLFIAVAIFFLILAVYALVAKAPKFVSVLLLLSALMIFFFGLRCLNGPFGSDYDIDLYKAMGVVSGIFAFLGFIVATYLGLAYANPKRIPVI